MKHSLPIAWLVSIVAVAQLAGAGEAERTRAERLSRAHATIAGPKREAIERYGASLQAHEREAYAALLRGVFEYARRLSAVVARVGGFDMGLRAELVRTLRAGFTDALGGGARLGKGLLRTMIAPWRAFLRGTRAALDYAGAPAVGRTLEDRFHALVRNVRTILADAVHGAEGTVSALLGGLEALIEPALRAAAELIRADPKSARQRYDLAAREPVSQHEPPRDGRVSAAGE